MSKQVDVFVTITMKAPWIKRLYDKILAGGFISGGHVARGLPGLGGFHYGQPNPYNHNAPHIGIDIEVGCGTRLFLPRGWVVAGRGVNGAIGHYLLLRSSSGTYVWLGHLNQMVQWASIPGQAIALTGSPESSGGFGHGCHLYFAHTTSPNLSWGASVNPVGIYNLIGRELFGLGGAGGGNAPSRINGAQRIPARVVVR